ncbi:MAG: hypothetical protein ACOWW1_05090 [archaeon]
MSQKPIIKLNYRQLKTVNANGHPIIDEEGTDNKLKFSSEDNAGNIEEVNGFSEIWFWTKLTLFLGQQHKPPKLTFKKTKGLQFL